MSKDELLDLVDKDDKVIGTVWKSEAHKDPSKIHREVGIVVITRNNEVLLQKRSSKKKYDAGQWQLGAAGHVAAGEHPLESAKRELSEETSIQAEPVFSYKFFDKYKSESRIFRIYYVLLANKVKLKWDVNEVDDMKWVKLDKALKKMKTSKHHS